MLPVSQILLSFIFLASFKTDAVFLTTDYLQNAYVISNQNSLVKIDSSGSVLFKYNQNRFGKLQFADATNPLKLVLSFPDYGTVVMLDNTLSEVGTISLRQVGILNYNTICFSSLDNNVWFFDSQDYKLKKIDNNYNIILESSDMFTLLGKAIHPVFMQEKDQYVYLSDPKEGIVVFDIYGTYYQTLPIYDIQKFQVRADQFFFQKGASLHSMHLKTLEEKVIALPDSAEVLDVRIEQDRLYLLKKDGLDIYKY